MATKSKRIIYSDADCHRLVDIIVSYRNIIECKKTDATTWKQKNTVWNKIADKYNCDSTQPRTSDQLRCKYDNLKKEVRKYEARKRRNLYLTGGGFNDAYIKAALKLLYEKIKSIINFSVNGLEPTQGDSDLLFEVGDTDECSNIEFEQIDHDDCRPIVSHNQISDAVDNVAQPQETNFEVNKDWSDYTPKMLKSKKHKVLQVKRKQVDAEDYAENEESLKVKMFNLKRDILEKEAAREEKYQAMRLEKEKELYDLKINNEILQNKKLELEIDFLKKRLDS